jgi:hypothetical protein
MLAPEFDSAGILLELLDGGSTGRIPVVGEAGQRIYPGGWHLADLCLEIGGRSFVPRDAT